MRVSCALIAMVSVAGCTTGDYPPYGVGPHCPPHVPLVVDPTGAAHQYVVDSLEFAATAAEAQVLGLDVDCDHQNRPDNALGQIISTLTRHANYDLDVETRKLIDAGDLLHLVQIQATSLDDAQGVGVLILHGEDLDGDPTDNLSGAEPFGIDESRGRGLTTGRIEGGDLTAEYGTAPVAVTFPGLDEPFVLRLVGARIDVEITGNGIAGRIGGAIPAETVDDRLIPVFQEGMSRIVARDCDETGCLPGSAGETLVDLFDDCSDGSSTCDGQISVDELRNNDLVRSLLFPDLDLFDELGDFNPRIDNVKDSLSIGLGFTAVGATFTAD